MNTPSGIDNTVITGLNIPIILCKHAVTRIHRPDLHTDATEKAHGTTFKRLLFNRNNRQLKLKHAINECLLLNKTRFLRDVKITLLSLNIKHKNIKTPEILNISESPSLSL